MTVGWLRDAFSDLRYDIQDEITEGEKVVVRVMSSGRQTGEFIGFPPTGNGGRPGAGAERGTAQSVVNKRDD